MREGAIFKTEAEFRQWFEKNLARFGVKKIVLSQEICPDYVLMMDDGRVVRAEAELFAINFRYHGHDPAKADLIIACYAKMPEVDGVPVLAANELWSEDVEPLEILPPEGPLSPVEETILTVAHSSGGMEISALASQSLSGDHALFMRLPPHVLQSVPRGKITDSLLSVVSADAKQFMKKYQHVLIGAGLSAEACEALDTLRRRGLLEYRPIELAAALYDGIFVEHPGWVPTEARATRKAWELHRETILRHMFPGRDDRS